MFISISLSTEILAPHLTADMRLIDARDVSARSMNELSAVGRSLEVNT